MSDGRSNDTAERFHALRLARTPRVGPVTYTALINRFGTAKAALEGLPDIAARGGGKPPRAPAKAKIEDEIAALTRGGAQLIIKGGDGYPATLMALDDAPPVLTVLGNISLLSKQSIAMVGARNASTVGRQLAQTLARDLGREGLVVASGLARGIDTAAHMGALDSGTVAVLAGGVDVIYPKENAKLYEEICECGAVISEMPWGAQPTAHLFPRRNRIVSGLSSGVIVVEAAKKSGSLITARLAGEQGRQVFAIPGNPMDPRAAGGNHLIREGATLVRFAQDIIEDLSPWDRYVQMPPSAFQPGQIPNEDAGEDARAAILNVLSTVPIHSDDVLRDTGIATDVFAAAVLELELAGKIERHGGGRLALSGAGFES